MPVVVYIEKMEALKMNEGDNKEKYDPQSRSYLLTINNPNEHGLDHEKIMEIIHSKFRNILYWCMCDEIGNNTGTYHIHIFVLLEKKKRCSSVKNAFPSAHIDIPKGTPWQNVDYVKKEGKWKNTEKSETNIKETFYEEGNLPKYFASENRKELLETAQRMIDDGLTPNAIFNMNILFRQIESIIRKQFYSKRFSETPPLRNIKVFFHLGFSGSGKSYEYTKLCEKYGADEVYFASDYANNCTALLDTYEAERVLFLDEVKIESFKYGYLLQILQGYRTPVHARYSNVYSLWEEVHMTSIYTPHELYEGMVGTANRAVDSEYQFLRRITDYVYHWKDDDGYHQIELPASKLQGKENELFSFFKQLSGEDGFQSAEGMITPFDDNNKK